MVDVNVMRNQLHRMADDLRSASGPLDEVVSNHDGVPPDAGKSTPLVGEVLAQIGMTVANLNEMTTRAATDVDDAANTYNGREQENAHMFDNLTPDVKPKQPQAGADKGGQ